MIKRALLSATLAATASTFILAACGGSTSSNNNNGSQTGSDSGTSTTTTPDGGTTVSTGQDGGTSTSKDSGGQSTSNPPLPDGSVYPHGTQLSTTPGLILDGVTSDDYVVYTDSSDNVFAVPVAGGTPIALGATDDGNEVNVVGKVVFIGAVTNQSNGAGSLAVWTSKASAPASISTSAYLWAGGGPVPYSLSADGSQVAFLDSVDAAGATATITVVGSDGSAKTPVAPMVDLADDVCFPVYSFGGSSLVAAYCPVGDAGAVDAGEADGGANPNVGVVTSFAGASWTGTPLASSAQTVFSVDSAGTEVVYLDVAGSHLIPIGGGTPVLIDANAEIGMTTFSPGIITTDGTGLIYTTTSHVLTRAAISPAATTVTTTTLGGTQGFSDVYGLSPNQQYAFGVLNTDQNGTFTDLYIASATAAGQALTLDSMTTGLGGDGSDLFTTDSNYALGLVGSTVTNGALTGTLTAVKTSGGTAASVMTGAITAYGTSGSKIVFNANFNGNTGGANLLGVDVSATAAPAVLVSQADPVFYVNAEKNTVIYTWNYLTTGASVGLWALATP